MSLPFFYIPGYTGSSSVELDEATGTHVVQVLRMKTGQQLNLTDGMGNLLHGTLSSAHKKNCIVSIESKKHYSFTGKKISIAISLLKNTSRFEWFLEKATELGIKEIVPLLCERTEKEKFRMDRMKQICISAMLQSQQCWLPALSEPQPFTRFAEECMALQKFIAHCEPSHGKQSLPAIEREDDLAILIGPEGDFTKTEISLAEKSGFIPVTLGNNRLRTETAAIVSAVLLSV